MNLFRVITHQNWQKAQTLGYVPRCGNDLRLDCVHLNLKEGVEYSANVYFTLEEAPVVLEINTATFKDKLEWLPPTQEKPWPQPRANVANISLSAVVSTCALQYIEGKFYWQ